MKIVLLEAGNLGEDVDLSVFQKLGEVTYYAQTNQEEVPERIKDANVVIINKLLMNEDSLKDAKNVELICVTATGTNNIDPSYVASRGITVTNVAGYSTAAVAQHTFAMLFYLLEKLSYYDHYVKSGAYCKSPSFTHFEEQFFELEGKTWGIIGMGAIGQKVAKLASAFGCRVLTYSATGRAYEFPYEQVSFEKLLSQSDVLSIHAPLSEHTKNLINIEAMKQMKQSAILLNVARGPIVNEEDLLKALGEHWIQAAGLDVLSQEPMAKDNPLLSFQDSRRLLITPHIAWAPTETRQRLINQVYDNIVGYQKVHKNS